jgi:hypothetical protein
MHRGREFQFTFVQPVIRRQTSLPLVEDPVLKVQRSFEGLTVE